MAINELWFPAKFDLRGQNQSTPKSIGILNKVYCIFPLVPARTGDEFLEDKLWIDTHLQ